MSKLPRILSVGLDAKTKKGEGLGILTGIMYLAPVKEGGRGNVCANASKGCAASCLFKAGMGRFPSAIKGRINRTKRFFDDQENFMLQLRAEIGGLVGEAEARGMKPAVRLNGTSDLPWEKIKSNGKTLMEWFPRVQFYDYTKSPKRALAFAKGKMPANYDVTFSRSECNHDDCLKVLRAGCNVAAVFASKLPAEYEGFPVIDGDISDARFLDTKGGHIVGLKAKGPAKRDTSGFVIQ